MFSKEEIKTRWEEIRSQSPAPDIHLANIIANNALFKERTRDGGPYMLHPMTVANDGTRSQAKQIIGMLHDVVEDSDWTLQDLRDVGFSERIVNGVDAVTKREGENYFDFVVRCGSSGIDGIDVKLNDLRHNLDSSRTPTVEEDLKHTEKRKVYNVSYYYLVALKQGSIEPGTPIIDFLKNHPTYSAQAETINGLLDKYSDQPERLKAEGTTPRFQDAAHEPND